MREPSKRLASNKSVRVRTILLATDLSPRSDRALVRAATLARQLGAKLTILHIVDGEVPQPALARMRDAAQSILDHQVQNLPGAARLGSVVRVDVGHDYMSILRCAQEIDADLLVLGVHRERPIADLFSGTTVERVARLGQRPLLVVKDLMKGPYRRVLAAADFSPCSQQAIKVAQVIAPGATFQLVHGYIGPLGQLIGSAEKRSRDKRAQEQGLSDLLASQMSSARDAKTNSRFLPPVVREGAVAEVIAKEVNDKNADLLVLGTHGRSALVQALLGSIAATFLNHPPCDVLVVPAA